MPASRSVALHLLAFLPLAAVSSREGVAATVTRSIGGFVVRADTVTGAWSVSPGPLSPPVLRGPESCEAGPDGPLGAVRVGRGVPSAKEDFGNFRIDLDPPGVSSMSWSSSCGSVPSVTTPIGELVIGWSIPGTGDVRLRFRADAGGGGQDLAIALESSSPVDAGEISWRAMPGEGYFGLGTQSFAMDLRGGTFPLWTQEQGIGKPDDGGFFPLQNYPEAAYAPMGVLHSSHGYSAMLATDAFAELDLAESVADRVTLRSYRELPSLVLVSGTTARARLAALTARTGRLLRPPRWVYAPWNDAVGGPLRLLQVVATLRGNDIPSSAIWSEDWAGGEEGPFGYRLSYAWEWDPATYPDLPADVARLHDLGFSFLVYFNPFVPQTTRMWLEGVAGGFLVKDASGGPYVLTEPGFRPSGLVDLTNPDAVTWLSGYLETAADDLAIDGWMADFAEWLPYDGVLDSGEDPWIAHNRYPLLWQQVNRDVLSGVHGGGDDWTYFARSGWASTRGATAGIAPLMWAGDQNTDWALDDGMPTVLPIAAHAGLSGVAIMGSDIGGYSAFITPPTTKELFFRWASLAAFHPLMRTHHGSSQSANWSFDRDAETLQHYRRLAILHTLLLPYLELLEEDAVDAGLPMSRHPWLVEPARAGLWQTGDYEIFLGDDVLVAPVLAEGATTRDVRLPEPGWWPMWGTAPVTAGAPGPGGTWAITVGAPLTTIPAFVRPGTTLPLLGDPVDSFRHATDPSVSDLRDVAGSFRLALHPDATGTLRERRAGAARVWATQLPSAIDWRTVLVDGNAVPACTAAPVPPCATADQLHLRGGSFAVQVGAGRLDIVSKARQSYVIGIARAAWATWAMPDTPPLPAP